MRNGEAGPIGHGRPGKQSGLAYVLLLIAIAVLGVVSASSLSIGSKMGKRDAERELLAIGAEFEQAFRSYAGFSGNVAAIPGGSGPRTLQDLLRDPRFPALKRHLRQVYFDPLTGSNEWGIVKNTAGFIVGIYSTAGGVPIQRTGFDAGKPHFENAESYSSWVFGLTSATLPNSQRVSSVLKRISATRAHTDLWCCMTLETQRTADRHLKSSTIDGINLPRRYCALRVARSAIQMLALSISQHEQRLEQRTSGIIGSLVIPDHDWIRGRDDET